MDLIDRQSAIEHCKKRLYESALDNVGVMCMANNVFSEIADNRIETWLNELPSAEPNLQPTCNQLATDCISRQGAIDAVNELTRWYYETFHEKRPTANSVIDKLMDLPSAEPRCIATIHLSQEQLDEAFEKVKADILSVKPKTGKWTIEDVHSATYKYCCSECKAHHRARYDFCPTCGAKMEDE